MRTALLLCLMSFTCSLATAHPHDATPAQEKKWIRLYPKLNSKMARMEEILNYIDRFFPSEEFHPELIEHALEFTFLSHKAANNLPAYLDADERLPFLLALKKTESLGNKLTQAIREKDQQKVTLLFKQLDTIRRKSHANWAL